MHSMKKANWFIALATLTSLAAQAEGWRNIRMSGVKGDGKADDAVAVQKALDQGGAWCFPKGIYVLGTITIPEKTKIQFEPGAMFKVKPDGIKDRVCIVLKGDEISLDGLTFDLRGPDGKYLSGKEIESLIYGKDIRRVRCSGIRAARPHAGTRPVWKYQGWTREINVIALSHVRDVEVDRCEAVHFNSLLQAEFCENVSVHENRAEWCEHLTRFDYGRGLRHYGNWSRHVVFQCVWWGGDPNDKQPHVPKGSARDVRPDLKPGDKEFNVHTAGAYDINVQNNYAEYGVTLAWGAKARRVLVDGNIARFMEDMAYDSEGDEDIVFSNNISINSKSAGIGCLYWTDKVLITGNQILVLDQDDAVYKGHFIWLHGEQDGPTHFGTGKNLISGNLFVSEVKEPRNIRIEGGRDITVSGNKFVNGGVQVMHQSWNVALTNNEFMFSVPGNYPCIYVTAGKISRDLIRGNTLRRIPNETDPSTLHAAIYINGGDNDFSTIHDIENNMVEGWKYSIYYLSQPWKVIPRVLIRNNTLDGTISVIGARNKKWVSNNLKLGTLTPLSEQSR